MWYYILICLFACSFYNVICQTECQNGWIHHGASCYYFSDNTKNWDTSSASCQAHHAELVTIETADENAFIYSITSKLGGSFWLDGTDEYSEGKWEWASTGYALDYSNWYPGEPNNDGDEDCLMTGDSFKALWNDDNCGSHQKFICEKKLDNTIVG
ncbi:perlucin-like protein [Mytilus trossulus]|uniref:perlucin-like protein n=1 Tax=Mytilus trossulus TaxID=6551 RepID=UPI003007AF02